MIGKKYGRLTILKEAERHSQPNGDRRRTVLCQCDCGNETKVILSNLKRGNTNSCGCLNKELVTKHGEQKDYKRSAEYLSFHYAKSRCRNKNNINYEKYGGRCIEFRFKDFDEFITELGRKPFPNYSLDRINNDGHYEKGNVRWANQKTQCRNTSANKIIEFKGQKKCLVEWAEENNIKQNTLTYRLKRGWSIERALTT